jgi:hypothetical protein
MADYIKFLPVDNGDSILFRVGDKSVLTDLHYRTSSDEHYDIKQDIKDACTSGQLNYFITTHTDKDHVRGFDDIFHRGKPKNKPDDKILVNEIVCTQYVLDLTNPSEEAKDLVNEIRRRNSLSGTEKEENGNRLRVVKSGDQLAINGRMKGKIISPSQIELDAANPKEDQDSVINNTSIVIQWTYQDGKDAAVTKIMLGGDAEREVWERLNSDEASSILEWNLSSAHHHCSLTPFAKKDDEGEYQDNEDAVNAISQPIGKNAFVVSSSREIKRSKPNPPHYKAKNRWVKIIGKEENFFCTATHKEGKAAPVIFDLTNKGIKKSTNSSGGKTAVSTSSASTNAGLNRSTKYGIV